MQWMKRGRIFELPEGGGWMTSHAAIPFTMRIGELHRIYFSARDGQGRARVGYFDLDLDDPTGIVRVSDQPVLDIGPLGAFDDNGVTGSAIVEQHGRLHLYYTGWNLGVTVPFYLSVGMAVSDDGGETFTRLSPAPILERIAVDPYLTASPSILVESGVWRMWYVSGTGWKKIGNTPRHYYHIRYAESGDGIHWDRQGRVCIDYRSEEEYAIARPFVLKDGGGYKMWYSYRGDSYRIGYAESRDGLSWQRKDEEAGLDVSASGWDSEMVAYPTIVDYGRSRYMLYNGNGYGRTGIGLAELLKNNGDSS